MPLKRAFGVHFPGTLLCAVVRVSSLNFMRLLRGTSVMLWSKNIFQKKSLEAEKLTFKNLKINYALNEDALAVVNVATPSHN